MDPYYFIDLTIKDNIDNYELHDLTDYGVDGSWIIDGKSNNCKIIYDYIEYDIIIYHNSTKKIEFINDDVIIKVLTLSLNSPNNKNIEIVKEIVDIIDIYKQNISTQQYINIMNYLQTQFNNN